MPPLRERGGDVLLLARHFAQQTARRYGLPHREYSADAMQSMREYPWPGNIRELKHQISRGVLLSRGNEMTAADLALPVLSGNAGQDKAASVATTLEEAEKMLIVNALKQSGGNVSEAARLLGITRMTIRYRMEKHGIREV